MLTNNRPAIRLQDPGIHAACCGTNTWKAVQGSATVFINNKAAVRRGDATQHCGGIGKMVEGSPNVIIGDSTTSGGGPVAASPTAMGQPSGGGGGRAAAARGGGGGSASPSASPSSNAPGSSSPASAPGGASPQAGPAASGQRDIAPEAPPEHVYVINSQLTAPGGNPIANEQVVLVKAGTDEVIAGPFTTDAEGGFATIVPENVPYDAQILDTGHPAAMRATNDDVQAHLHVGIFENGMPVAGESVTVIRPDGSSFAAVLDGDGMLDLAADHGEHQISIRGETFHVHTLTGPNLEDGGSHYELAVAPSNHDFETARANRYHPDRDDEGVV